MLRGENSEYVKYPNTIPVRPLNWSAKKEEGVLYMFNVPKITCEKTMV